jgi:hypothetical protein
VISSASLFLWLRHFFGGWWPGKLPESPEGGFATVIEAGYEI